MKAFSSICLILLMLFFYFVGCSQGTAESNKSNSDKLLGLWQLSKVIQGDSTVGKPDPYTGRFDVQLNFKNDSTITGTSSMNPISGRYSISNAESISISIMYGSKLGEKPWGMYFQQGIGKVTSFSLIEDDLQLKSNAGVMIFKKIN